MSTITRPAQTTTQPAPTNALADLDPRTDARQPPAAGRGVPPAPALPPTSVLPGDYIHQSDADAYSIRTAARRQYGNSGRIPVRSLPTTIVGWWKSARRDRSTGMAPEGSLLARRPLTTIWSTVAAGLLVVTGFWSTGIWLPVARVSRLCARCSSHCRRSRDS